MRPAHGTGVVLRDPLPWPEVREIAGTAEDTGYAALFVPEIAGREAFTTLTGLAGATERMALGTGVVPMDSRRPDVTAMAAATLQEVCGGRHVLGLGAGHPPPGSAPGPVERMGRYVEVVRGALRGRPVSEALFGVGGFSLEVPPADPPPLWLAALRDRMLALAGEVADGVLLNWCTPERAALAVEAVTAAAGRSGRNRGDVTVAVYVRACVGAPPGPALRALQEMTGRYASLPNYLRHFEAMGMGASAREAASAFQAGRPEEVPSALVDALCVRGDRDAWLARASAFREAGVDLILCYPVAALDPFSSVLGTVLACAPSPAVEG